MTAETQKLSREKRELENALSTLKKNSVTAQEELAKGSRKLAAEMQSVKRENIRLREVCMYLCTYIRTYMCVWKWQTIQYYIFIGVLYTCTYLYIHT